MSLRNPPCRPRPQKEPMLEYYVIRWKCFSEVACSSAFHFTYLIFSLIHLFSCVIIFLNKDQVRQHLVSTIGLDGLSLLKAFGIKTHLWRSTLGWVFTFSCCYWCTLKVQEWMFRITALESSHLSLPWFHLLSKGNHTHPRFNCIYILPVLTSAHKRSHLIFVFSFTMSLSFLSYNI